MRATRAVLGTERMEYYREMERKSEERWEFLQARARGEPLGDLQGSLWRADEHLRGGPIEVVGTESQLPGQNSGEEGSAEPSKDIKEAAGELVHGKSSGGWEGGAWRGQGVKTARSEGWKAV